MIKIHLLDEVKNNHIRLCLLGLPDNATPEVSTETFGRISFLLYYNESVRTSTVETQPMQICSKRSTKPHFLSPFTPFNVVNVVTL